METSDSIKRIQVSAGGVVFRVVPLRVPIRDARPPVTTEADSGQSSGTVPSGDGGGEAAAASPVTVTLASTIAAEARIDVALIRVGRYHRWQLPKGTVEPEETREAAALREVREETGLNAELVVPIETIEYFYRSYEEGQWVHFHKFVSFYLMRFLSGSVADHDNEVHEARWIEIGQAIRMLAFENERRLVVAARQLLRPR